MHTREMKSLAFFCLAAASSAVDVYYYRNEWCGGTPVGGRTLACGRNQVPLSPSIGGFDLRYTNGIVVEFYDRRDCTGGPWFTDDGKGGCVKDRQARTNCLNVRC